MNLHPDWIVPEWPQAMARRDVRAVITTRAGGASVGALATLNLRRNAAEDAAVTLQNLARLHACLPSQPIWLKQVHGVAVLDVDAWQDQPAVDEAPTADASVTARANTVLAIQTADCLPVFLVDSQAGVLGAAHAGWRGLAAGVLEATVATMVAKGATSGTTCGYFGPAISQAAFEVGEDVLTAFVSADRDAVRAFRPHPTAPNKWFADLFMLARQRMNAVGVHAISGGKLCTHSHPERFYSYRRDGRTGHMASLIWRIT